MQKSVFIAQSLDGYIARENGDIDWLEEFNKTVPKGVDCGYGEFYQSVDHLILGRNSFEKILEFDSWPYTSETTVLTQRGLKIPESLEAQVKLSSESPQVLCNRLESEGFRHLYIDGGKVIQSFLRSGLIDDMIITTIPVLIGSGSSLFGSLSHDVKLQHQKTISYPFGAVQSVYKII